MKLIQKFFCLIFFIDTIIGLSMFTVSKDIQPIFAHISGATTLATLIAVMIFTYFKLSYDRTIYWLSMTTYGLMAFFYICYMYFQMEAINFPFSSFGFDISTTLFATVSALKDLFIFSLLLKLTNQPNDK